MSLSLCMIVKDEEVALPQCLQSVQTVVDEIVIVDTGSSDRTVQIAKNWGASVYPFTWCDDFSAARNESLKYAQSEWILVLDADEVLLPEIIPTLKQAIQTEQYLAIHLLRQEVGAKQAPYSLISRLFRNHADIAFSRPYHELIDDHVAAILQREPQWQVTTLPGIAIQHTGYQAETIAQRRKFDRAKTTMERFLAAHPDDAYICNKLGALYVECGQVEQGLALLERGLQSFQVEPPVLYELHYHLGSTYSQLQNWAQAAFHYQAAIAQPLVPHLKLGAYNNLGSLLKEQGNLIKAKAVYEKTLEIDPQFAPGYYNLGMTLKALGQLEAAIAHYQQAIQLNPTYAEAYQNLGVTWLKLGQVRASLEAFQRAIALHRQQGSPEAEHLVQGLKEMGFDVEG